LQRTINRVLAHVGLRVVFLLAWLRRRSHAQVEAVTALELRVHPWASSGSGFNRHPKPGWVRFQSALTTTRRDDSSRPASDLVDRNFAASGPNQLWVADITFLPTAAGFL